MRQILPSHVFNTCVTLLNKEYIVIIHGQQEQCQAKTTRFQFTLHVFLKFFPQVQHSHRQVLITTITPLCPQYEQLLVTEFSSFLLNYFPPPRESWVLLSAFNSRLDCNFFFILSFSKLAWFTSKNQKPCTHFWTATRSQTRFEMGRTPPVVKDCLFLD